MIPLLDMRVNMLCNGGSNDGILTFYVGDPGLIPRQCMPLAARHFTFWASLVAQMVKNLPVMKENWVQSLGREDPLEKGMATHSSILTWEIPWAEEPGWLQCMGSQRVAHE